MKVFGCTTENQYSDNSIFGCRFEIGAANKLVESVSGAKKKRNLETIKLAPRYISARELLQFLYLLF